MAGDMTAWRGALLVEGIAVQDQFLSQCDVRALIACASRRIAGGEFNPAGVGTDIRLQRRPEIRGDHTCWIVPPLFAAEKRLSARLEALRLDLNRAGYLGLFDLEWHYARYPPGAGYVRHVDQPFGGDERVVSIVLYLNAVWPADGGGQLRLFAAQGPRDIEPQAGRLVGFLTCGQEHAVLPTLRDRLSISGWFRRRASTISA